MQEGPHIVVLVVDEDGLKKITSWSEVFFFSSRRRHTRYWRDWSSDVCSSDLILAGNSAPSSPDLFHVGSVFSNSVSYSLIGSNMGTSLVESQMPDANQNLIGDRKSVV